MFVLFNASNRFRLTLKGATLIIASSFEAACTH